MFFNNVIEKLLIRKRRNLGILKALNKDMHMCISKPLNIIKNSVAWLYIFGKKKLKPGSNQRLTIGPSSGYQEPGLLKP